jgi:putative ABC transport system ATP-binding protein
MYNKFVTSDGGKKDLRCLTMNTGKLLEVRNLQKFYNKDGVPTKALNGITFDVFPGEYLGIMGASGSGKTTLLNCIATIIKPTSGQIMLSGENISAFSGSDLAEYRGTKIGYLFQDFALLDNLTGKENILLPLSIHNVAASTAEKKLFDLADFLGIRDVLEKFPSQMSGGQKQRVAAARCLISNPSIILADEPTGALDTKSARQLMEKLQEINQKQQRTILMVTHDPNAASFCTRILFIQDGVIFHEIRKQIQTETQEAFYERILQVMAQMGGGSANVL